MGLGREGRSWIFFGGGGRVLQLFYTSLINTQDSRSWPESNSLPLETHAAHSLTHARVH